MSERIFTSWNNRVTGEPIESTRLFVTALYVFLLLKIVFLFPIAQDMVSYYQYHSASILKQVIVAPGMLARLFPMSFLIIVTLLTGILIFIKRTYFSNALGFWISINVIHFSEPVANGSDYVLSLMLFLSIPLTPKPLVQGWKEWQPLIFNFSILLIQVHIGLIYFLSGFNKLTTESWRSGDAIAYIAQLDYYASPVVSGIQSASTNAAIAWFTIAFELLFPLLIWFKKVRVPVLITGVIFHLGIVFFLNLPDFGFLMIICYAIFLKGQPGPMIPEKVE